MWEYILGVFIFAVILASLIGLGILTKALFNTTGCYAKGASIAEVEAAKKNTILQDEIIKSANASITGLPADLTTLVNNPVGGGMVAASVAKGTYNGIISSANASKLKDLAVVLGEPIPDCTNIDLDKNDLNVSRMGIILVWIMFIVGVILGIASFAS